MKSRSKEQRASSLLDEQCSGQGGSGYIALYPVTPVKLRQEKSWSQVLLQYFTKSYLFSVQKRPAAEPGAMRGAGAGARRRAEQESGIILVNS